MWICNTKMHYENKTDLLLASKKEKLFLCYITHEKQNCAVLFLVRDINQCFSF